jgi:hypothetical protein
MPGPGDFRSALRVKLDGGRQRVEPLEECDVQNSYKFYMLTTSLMGE